MLKSAKFKPVVLGEVFFTSVIILFTVQMEDPLTNPLDAKLLTKFQTSETIYFGPVCAEWNFELLVELLYRYETQQLCQLCLVYLKFVDVLHGDFTSTSYPV